MGDLSEHFSRYEFACKCGCGMDTIDVETLGLCEQVREHVGVSLIPNSGCRCEAYNEAVGGSVGSQHLQSRAVDLPVPDPKEVYGWLCAKYPKQYGFGVYDTFVHVDSRPGPVRWDNRSK